MRHWLYTQLLTEYGPYHTWGGRRTPPQPSVPFDAMMERLARYLSHAAGRQLTAGAVAQQVAWGVTRQTLVRGRSRVRNFLLNKAAALEVGLLTSEDLPAMLATPRAVYRVGRRLSAAERRPAEEALG
jgi:hypothetical protein